MLPAIVILLLVFLPVSVFLGVAIILLWVVPSHMKKKVADCTLPVPAVIVGGVREYISNVHNGNAPNYAYVYEFVWNGMTCQRKATLNSSKLPPVGEQRILMVAPNNIDRFYDPTEYKRAQRIFKIVGIAMLVTGIFCLLVMAGVGLLMSVVV